MHKRRFDIESDIEDGGIIDQLPVDKKCRRVSAFDLQDGSGDENLRQYRPLIRRSPMCLGYEDSGSGSHLLNTESEPNSPRSSFVKEKTVTRQERPINYCFLRDLSSPKSIYVSNFHNNKQKLIRRLYKFYNRTVFEDKLPAYMDISWNKRLCKVAGRTGFRENNGVRYAIIQLSDKVCDSAERLRDTMIHEMCHAACWVIDGNGEYAHHQLWEQYCGKAAQSHPDLPPITAFHSWEYHYPVIYQCSECPYRIGRWTNSLDVERFGCGYCDSKLVLVTTT